MTLDDIPKLFGAGEENGSVLRHRANDTISHNVPSPETVENPLSDTGTRGFTCLRASPSHFNWILIKSLRRE